MAEKLNKESDVRIIIGDYGFYSSDLKLGPHHYADLLASEFKVLYYSSPSFLLMPLIYRVIKGNRRTIKAEEDEQHLRKPANLTPVHGYSIFPAAIPLSPNFFTSSKEKIWWSRRLIHTSLLFSFPSPSYILKKNGFDIVHALMLEDFRAWPLLNMVKAKIKIYHMRDDFSGDSGLHDLSESLEPEIVKAVDKVIVTAKNLESRASRMGAREVVYLPNGVDLNHFNQIPQSIMPEDLKVIPHPRIIYVGNISDHIDTDLLGHCSRQLPGCSFILIGPTNNLQRDLLTSNNIYFLGVKSYESLPGYLRNCEVGIIPFKKNSLTDSVCPIKLFEYMAAGLPVVCTNLIEVRNMNTPAFIAKDKNEFMVLIKRALEAKKQTKSLLIEFARQNTWDQRYLRLKNILGLR